MPFHAAEMLDRQPRHGSVAKIWMKLEKAVRRIGRRPHARLLADLAVASPVAVAGVPA